MFLVSKNFMPKRGISRLCIKKLLSHSTEKKCWNNSVYWKTSGVEKTLCKGVSRFSVWKFLFHSAEKIRWRIFLCLTKFRLSKNFIDKSGREGVSQISVYNFMSQCLKISYGNPLVCHFFWVLENFMLKRVTSWFWVEIFCLTVSKKIVATIRCIGKLQASKKLLAKGDHDFLWTMFCLTRPKIFVRETFCVLENFRYRKKIYGQEGGGVSRFSVENICVSQYWKFS